MTAHLDVVFLDVGGVLYDEAPYRDAILRALREMGSEVSDAEYLAGYDRCRRAQDGSFRARLSRRFLGPDVDIDELTRRASAHWAYPPGSLHDDVPGCLDALAGRYRLGLIANQQSAVREAIRRDGIEPYFEVWAISEDLGFDKPDPRLFRHALDASAADPERTAMCGDRLDYDVRPAQAVGMRTVWVLRGEAPDDPTPEQLAEPDAAVRSLADLPAALGALP
jgi:FMN phosphatase YigB (HAD superfamily)